MSQRPVHPGEILREEYLRPLGLMPYRLAQHLHVPVPRVNDVIRGRRAITPDTALRLARYFGTTDRFWLNLQARYDLDRTRHRLGRSLAAITPRGCDGR